MSDKACTRCGGRIVFGRERDTGKVLPLSVGAKVYRVIKGDEIELDPKALVPHVCGTYVAPATQDRDFSEPQGANDD